VDSLSFLLPVKSTSNYTWTFKRQNTEVTKDTVGEMTRNNQQFVLQKLSMERIKKLSSLPKAWEKKCKQNFGEEKQVALGQDLNSGTSHKQQVSWRDDRKARNYSIYKNKTPKC